MNLDDILIPLHEKDNEPESGPFKIKAPFVSEKIESEIERRDRNIRKTFPKRLSNELIEKFPDDIDKMDVWQNLAYKSVFLHGPAGTGKTFSAACISMSQKKGIKSLMHRVKFVVVSDLLRTLRNAIGKPIILDAKGKTPSEALVDSCMNAYILILDDIGVEKQSDYVDEILYTIINYRYNEMKQTIVTSNYSPQKLVIRLGDDRLVSRLTSMGPVLVLKKRRRSIAK